MALSALQDFFELGGQPDAQMFDTVLDVCVRTGRFRRAMQVCSYLAMALEVFRDIDVSQGASDLSMLFTVQGSFVVDVELPPSDV